jgi:predicted dehydrogenase
MPALARLGWSSTVLDIDHERASSLARRYPRASASTASITSTDLGGYAAVVVATPLTSHHELTMATLEAGARTVLVEKPPFATAAELTTALESADLQGARLLVSWVTRGWPPIQLARQLFPRWLEEFGALARVLVAQGRPWAWGSVAARERGAAGLESLVLEELPHPLDSVFYISGWRDVAIEMGSEPATDTPWKFSGSVFVTSGNDAPVMLEIRGSRTDVLANAVVFEFERAAVSIELSPTGGVIVHRDGECQLELSGIRESPDVRDVFAGLLAEAAGKADAAAPAAAEADEWAGPVSVIDVLRERRPPTGEPA